MNRYLLRSLVAVSTFLLSIAVSAIIHPFGHTTRWEHRYSTFVYREHSCRREMSFSRPSLSIDAAATDPVKLLYSQTVPQANSSLQHIVLLLDSQTSKPINSVVVQYSSLWPARNWDVETVRVPYDSIGSANDLQTLSIDCGSDQTLWLWISRIEFKDGSRWINPRHPSEKDF